jgi:hypothetical protein
MDTWVWVTIAVGVIIAVAVVVWVVSARARRRGLRDRFGEEYDRSIDAAGSRRRAERDLRDRESQHEELELRPLSDASRARYEESWADVQTRFVDRPQVAVADADDLVTQLMRERGYPVDDFDTKARLVSVDHPNVVENYRKGHGIYEKTVEGSANTEDLRQAVISYRALFEEIIHDSADTA